MTYEQIIALTERGFTPAQVMQLAGVRDSPEEVAAPEAPTSDPEPAPEAPPSDPEQPNAPETPPAENNTVLDELRGSVQSIGQQLAALIKVNQDANIKNIIREDSPRGETADDILAGIIHPPMNESKGGNNK